MRPQVVKIVIAVCLVIVAIVGAPWAEGTANQAQTTVIEASPARKACGDFQISGPVPYPPIKVEVVQGKVPCRVARRVMKDQFRGSAGVPDTQTPLSLFPVVDNFNRPDQGPPPGAGWVNQARAIPLRAEVSNNQLVADPTSAGDYGFAGYRAKSDVPPVAVGITIASLASAWDDYLELSVNPDRPSAERAYFELGFFSRPEWGSDGWLLWQKTPDGKGRVGAQDHLDPWAVGDQVVLTYDGTTVAAWRRKVGKNYWIKLAQFTDTSLAGRPLYGTIFMSKDNSGNALDDFRFGSISPGSVGSTSPANLVVPQARTDTNLWNCVTQPLGFRVCERNRGLETIRGRLYCRDWSASIATDWQAERLRCLDTFGPP